MSSEIGRSGYCPAEDFHWYRELQTHVGYPDREYCDSVLKSLGKRIDRMEYTEAGRTWKGYAFVIRFFARADAAEEAAEYLKELVPDCDEGEEMPKIWVTDCITPYQIPGMRWHDQHWETSDGYPFFVDKYPLLSDDSRFGCKIIKEDDGIHIYIADT